MQSYMLYHDKQKDALYFTVIQMAHEKSCLSPSVLCGLKSTSKLKILTARSS